MRKRIRGKLLRALKTAGVFERLRDSRWRRRQLLILCYHSLALDEENLWRPALFLAPGRLRERFEMLKQGGYHVLPLAEGLERLRRNDLAPRSVVLTFDDGSCDFHKLAYPLLREYGFPATVYQTTHYCSRRMPIYSLICSYMLWKKREAVLSAAPSIGIAGDIRLDTAENRQLALGQIVAFADREQLSTEQKNQLAADLARRLGVDYEDLLRRRILQLMTPEEIAELAAAGINFELHTHRHRTPRDRALFIKEIRDNREALEALTRTRPTHFCYPSGDYDLMFLPWLAEEGIVSATTCDPGLVCVRSRPLLLPRFIDTTAQTELEFESWLTGVGSLLSTGANAARLRQLAGS
ncbi:MAG TPA: polysaccharide deacetylase family protein [Candidatus Sulfotelmatobacter sp.]|nr:polysaccharide deacetylase family protein [Candidatus Sulfotelmatobacter sp.]